MGGSGTLDTDELMGAQVDVAWLPTVLGKLDGVAGVLVTGVTIAEATDTPFH